MKILLVDDSKTMRNIQKKALAALAPEVTFVEAGDGLEALGVMAQHAGQPFNIMLVDWNMPNMNGLDFVARVRETDRKTLAVMVTTESEKQRVLDAIKAGANNYVVKPFTPETLLEKIQQTLSKAAAAAAA